VQHFDALRAAAEATTSHGRLRDLRFTAEGNHVYLLLDFTTGDAAGQNMVTIATQAELSIIAALSAHQFAQAHARLARGRKPKVPSAGAPA
jgi:hydroxymethylglutaryl-CoA reductase